MEYFRVWETTFLLYYVDLDTLTLKCLTHLRGYVHTMATSMDGMLHLAVESADPHNPSLAVQAIRLSDGHVAAHYELPFPDPPHTLMGANSALDTATETLWMTLRARQAEGPRMEEGSPGYTTLKVVRIGYGSMSEEPQWQSWIPDAVLFDVDPVYGAFLYREWEYEDLWGNLVVLSGDETRLVLPDVDRLPVPVSVADEGKTVWFRGHASGALTLQEWMRDPASSGEMLFVYAAP